MTNPTQPPQSQPQPVVVLGGVAVPPPGTLATYTSQPDQMALQTRFTLDMTEDSLVAIAVSEAETQIRKRLATLVREQTARQTLIRTLINDANDLLRDFLRLHIANTPSETIRLNGLVSAAPAFLGAPPPPVFSIATYHRQSGTLQAYLTFDQGSFSFKHEYEVPAPDEYVNLYNRIETESRNLEEINREILGVRQALNNVDALERMAKSNLAKQMAERSGEAGKALVQGIQSTVDADQIIDMLRGG